MTADASPGASAQRSGRTLQDLLDANARAAAVPVDLDATVGRARASLAVLTCMDARIDPNAALGLDLGDAVVLRNPGGQVDGVALAGLVLGVRLLGVRTILLVRHTRCAMASSAARLRSALVDAGAAAGAVDGLELHAIDDQDASLRADVERVRTEPALADAGIVVHGLRYDVETRLLTVVVP